MASLAERMSWPRGMGRHGVLSVRAVQRAVLPDPELTTKEPMSGRSRGLGRRGAGSSTSCPLGAVQDQKGAFPTNLVSVRTELLADTGSVVSPSWFTEATATPIPSGQHEQQAITR
jgi:hypothetical protein